MHILGMRPRKIATSDLHSPIRRSDAYVLRENDVIQFHLSLASSAFSMSGFILATLHEEPIGR